MSYNLTSYDTKPIFYHGKKDLYPFEYLGPLPIGKQIDQIAKIFSLNPSQAHKYSQNLPLLPDGAEGWFAVPKLSVIIQKNFPDVDDPITRYSSAVRLMMDQFSSYWHFMCFHDIRNRLRQVEKTTDYMFTLESQQAGDILIIPAQFGKRYAGQNYKNSLSSNEFDLDTFTVGSMSIVHRYRYTTFMEVEVGCYGDQYKDEWGNFGSGSQNFFYHGYDVGFMTDGWGPSGSQCARVTGFIPD